jgi:hypothetical protein
MWAVGLTMAITVVLTSIRAIYRSYKKVGKKRQVEQYQS